MTIGGPQVENLCPPTERHWPRVEIDNFCRDYLACGSFKGQKMEKIFHAISQEILL